MTDRKSDEEMEDEVRSCAWYVGWEKGPRSSSPPRRAPGKKGMEAGLRAALLAMAGNVAGGNKEGWGGWLVSVLPVVRWTDRCWRTGN